MSLHANGATDQGMRSGRFRCGKQITVVRLFGQSGTADDSRIPQRGDRIGQGIGEPLRDVRLLWVAVILKQRHRDHAQSVRFVAGHLCDGGLDLDWAELARPRQTLVFYMGITQLATICAEAGRAG